MSDQQWTDQANAIAARYEHGHTFLTDGCSLCHAEYDEIHAITHLEARQ